MSTMVPSDAPTPVGRPEILKPHWIPREANPSDEAIKDFMDKIIDDRNPFRRWHMYRKARNWWFYRGRHWIMERRELRQDVAGSYRFDEIRPRGGRRKDRVLPVTNFIASTVDNEVSRLGRREYTAQNNPTRNTPELLQAARLAKDVSAYNLKLANFPNIREALNFDLVLGGDCTYKTWLEETDEDTVRIGSPKAMACPACGLKLSTATVPYASKDSIMAGLDQAEYRMDDEHGQVLDLKMCPECSETPQKLQPYDVTEEEAKAEPGDPMGLDYFERELGADVPRCESRHACISPFNLYPMGGGAAGEPEDTYIIGERQVRELDWIAAHVPEWADKLEKVDGKTLLKQHPTMGDHGWGSAAGDAENVYPSHAFFDEVHVQPRPIPGLEMGLSFIRCGTNVAVRPLCVEVEDPAGSSAKKRKVAKYKYQTARFKRIAGEFWGRTVVDDMVPINRGINLLDFQMECVRDGGVPQVWVPTDVDLLERESDDGGAWMVMEYEGGPQGWKPSDAILNRQPIAGEAYLNERNAKIADLQKVGAAQDVELGAPPGGSAEMNTSYLMTLNEEAAQKRGTRERYLTMCLESGWSHDLELTWVFRKEDSEYEVVSKADTFEKESFKGADILGQTAITIQKRAGYDNAIYTKTAAREAKEDGAIQLDSPLATDRYLELCGLPKDINEDRTIQVTRAEFTWSEFMRRRKFPVVDETVQDPWVRYQVYGKRWEGDECVQAREAINFDETVMPVVFGWQAKLDQVDAQEALTRPIYGNQPPEAWKEIYQKASALRDKAAHAAQTPPKLAQAAAMTGQPVAPAQVPPPVPQPPVEDFLPESLDRRIYAFWRRLLGQAVQVPPAPAEAVGLKKVSAQTEMIAFLKMRAIIEAYRMLAERKKATQGAIAAPGGAATPAGTEPVPGAPVQAAPGAGPAPMGGMAA